MWPAELIEGVMRRNAVGVFGECKHPEAWVVDDTDRLPQAVRYTRGKNAIECVVDCERLACDRRPGERIDRRRLRVRNLPEGVAVVRDHLRHARIAAGLNRL